jgi:hypothetical protein
MQPRANKSDPMDAYAALSGWAKGVPNLGTASWKRSGRCTGPVTACAAAIDELQLGMVVRQLGDREPMQGSDRLAQRTNPAQLQLRPHGCSPDTAG